MTLRFPMPKKAVQLLALMLTSGLTSYSQLAPSTQNYVSVTDVLVSGLTSSTQVDAATRDQRSTVYTYCDGLGRPSQTVLVQSSPLRNDIIQPVIYDAFGREFRKYLPFVASGSGYRDNTTIINATTGAYIGDAANFYNNASKAIADDGGRPFAETRFEPSPLGRVMEQGAPGTAWQPDATNSYTSTDRTIKFAYENNVANEVRLWTYTSPTTANPSGVLTSAFYSANQLYKTKTKDEQYHEVIEYKDKEGKLVLKKVQAPGTNAWAETHYVYDDFGNLACVIQPEGASRISEYFAASDVDKTSFLKRWAFCYAYDGKKRMKMKQVPGADPVYMVYDTHDRLVMTQDGRQRSANQWMYTKYDFLNRPIITGIYTHPTAVDQTGMQSLVNTITVFYETYSGVAASYGYTTNVFPVSGFTGTFDPLTVTYYDTYDFKTLFYTNSFDYRNSELDGTGGYAAQEAAANQNVLNQVTGVRVRMITTGTWLKSVHYYDNKYRLIQTIADNTKGHEITTTTYDFAGKPLRTKTSLYTGQPVTWSSVAGATAAGNSLSFTGTTGSAWSQGGMTSQVLPPNSDGWVELTVPQVTAGFAIGLADQYMGPNYTSIDFAWYVDGGQLNSSENGTIVARGNVVSGDVLRIERVNGKIYWKRNGLIVYAPSTSTAANTSVLFVCTSLKTAGSKVANVVVSNVFTVPASYAATSSFVKRFGYDHAGRLVDTWHKLTVGSTAGNEILLIHNSYNELGQLIDKKLHSTVATAADAKQSVDYRYNIRGWLTSINNAELSNIGTNDDTGDLFGMNLAYNDDMGTGNSSNLQYNGNINAIKWSSGLGLGAIKQMAYNFTYDPMNRLQHAIHKQANVLNTWLTGQYDERGLTYDLNGNIQTLRRKGAGRVMVDSLTYNYGTTSGNQLQYVTDNAPSATRILSFNDSNTGTNDYAYDVNGNLTVDLNKTMSIPITYNYLNLPEQVVRGTSNDYIQYVYDATGTKRGQVLTQKLQQKVTDYVGPWIFENNQLQFVQHDEGRVVISSEQKLYANSFDVITPDIVVTPNVSLSTSTLNGEKYVNVSCTTNGGPVKQGVTFSKVYVVTEGERYLFRLKGYFNGNNVSLYAKGNGADLVWPGTEIPKGSVNETWVESTIVIPQGVSQLTLGVAWQVSSTTTDNILLNEMEFYKLGTNATSEYQYNLKDHLGNVRVTFTSQPQTKTYTAGFETANQTTEANNFNNYPSGGYINTLSTNAHAPSSNSEYLHGGYNKGQVGVAKSFSVMPGDVVQIQAYVKYNAPSSTTANYSNFVASLLSAFSLPAPLSGEVGTASYGVTTFGNWEIGPTGDESKNDAIKAFITIILFDKNYNFLDVAYQPAISSGALISKSYTVREPGYAYLYISNEHPTLMDVYFDDVTMTFTPSPVIAEQFYYPFGMLAQSNVRESSVPNSYLYNGKELQEELGLGWLDYGLRMYDPTIARWMVVDPWATKYKNWSPYNYGFDNPVRYADFMGLGPEDKKDPNGMSETQVYSKDETIGAYTRTTVTQETQTKTTTENEDGTTTTTFSRSVTSNTVTKNNETGETSVAYGKTKTSSYSETTNSDGKIVASTPSATTSKTTSQNDKSMKNLNAWTNKIATFNASHDKTFNQTAASDGRRAMIAGALAPTILFPMSGTALYLNAGGGVIVTLADGAFVAPGIVSPGLIGAGATYMQGMQDSNANPGRTYSHSTSQTRIRDGMAIPLMQHNILDR